MNPDAVIHTVDTTDLIIIPAIHGDVAIMGVQDYNETHYSDKLTVDFLAAEIGLGRRTLERRFRQATNNTVSEYVQRVRIEAAKKRLESGGKAVIEVMYDVGYSDLKAFRKVFKTITGMTPRDYRRKNNRDAVSI